MNHKMSLCPSTRKTLKRPHFPNRTDTKRGTELKYDDKIIVGPRVSFEVNQISSQKRTFGFQKAMYSGTPYPTMNTDINTNLLMDRLKHLDESSVTMSEDSATLTHFNTACTKPNHLQETKRIDGIDPKKVEKISFEERRKKFYEAEYTITQGIKMSEIAIQPAAKPKISMESSESIRYSSNELFDAEKLARKFNIKLNNCFDF